MIALPALAQKKTRVSCRWFIRFGRTIIGSTCRKVLIYLRCNTLSAVEDVVFPDEDQQMLKRQNAQMELQNSERLSRLLIRPRRAGRDKPILAI
jgi:hypothetical protein